MIKQCLNQTWRLHEAPLYWDKAYLNGVRQQQDGWYCCNVPTDVRIPLIENQVIRDPVLADYCLESEWIEKRSWWFFKEFELDEAMLQCEVLELVIEKLDTHSDIFINGRHIGTHDSVHYPFTYSVEDFIHEGKNELAVRVTTGLERVSDEQLSELNWAVCHESNNGGKYRGDRRRAFVRRPQYTVGWDWGPKVLTCGITGDVFLKGYHNIAIREVSVRTESVSPEAVLDLMVNVENLNFLSTRSGSVCAEISYNGEVCASAGEEEVLFTSGYNYLHFRLTVTDPKLWWPNGYGDHPLYDIRVTAKCAGIKEEYQPIRYGIRTIRLDTSVIKGENRHFDLWVNDVRIFCKGGDWIPNDSIYVRTTDEKYKTLIQAAAEANFNTLRIWGGGLYEKELFYSLCDENGLLLWHDFMFACATYPDHLPWFREIVRQELDYQTKRLRNHPCIALFCGSNENHWIFNSHDNPQWNIKFKREMQYGLSIANIMAKEMIKNNCPQIPYWNSSPYGGEYPNDDTVGDVHRWHDAFMSKKMEDRIDLKSYDDVTSKFVSEYGYVGPCCLESTKEYMDHQPIDLTSPAWEMHKNVFEKETVYAGIEKHYTDHPEQLSLEDYILYGGMVQGLVLGYSLEAIRFKEDCGGAIFWMYNDAWGEIGWTIIDYYMRRKISYYGVKRAFAKIKLTLRVVDNILVVQGCNDTEEPIVIDARLGYVSFDGTTQKLEPMSFTLPAHSRCYLYRQPLPDEDYRKGSIMLFADKEDVDSVLLRLYDIRRLDFGGAAVRILETVPVDGGKRLTLCADQYAHGVYVEGDYLCSDNYFDLLPGEKKTITVACPKNAVLEIKTVK